MEMQPEATAAIERVLEAKGIPYEEVMTWTTDGFYRETAEKVGLSQGRRLCCCGDGVFCACGSSPNCVGFSGENCCSQLIP